MVPSSSVPTCPEANIPTAIENSVVPPNLSECNAPTLQENETSYLSLVRKRLIDTLARWVKNILSSAGVDTSKFKAHSTRSAATSFAAKQNVNVTDILSAVGWSSEQTFQRFYNRPDQTDFNFGTVILNSSDL